MYAKTEAIVITDVSHLRWRREKWACSHTCLLPRPLSGKRPRSLHREPTPPLEAPPPRWRVFFPVHKPKIKKHQWEKVAVVSEDEGHCIWTKLKVFYLLICTQFRRSAFRKKIIRWVCATRKTTRHAHTRKAQYCRPEGAFSCRRPRLQPPTLLFSSS